MLIDSSLSAIVTGGASGLGLATVKALRANGAKVAIFDINQDQGEAIAADVGATFCKVDILSEDSALAGFDQARAAQGQERLLVHCAMVSKGGKTVSKDKDNGGFKRLSTEDYALIVAEAVRKKLGATWGLCESGASGPTGNFYGDAAGHVAVALSGPRTLSRTMETGSADREGNMWRFAGEALSLLQEGLVGP